MSTTSWLELAMVILLTCIIYVCLHIVCLLHTSELDYEDAKAEAEASNCRTADWAAIHRQTVQLRGQVPDAPTAPPPALARSSGPDSCTPGQLCGRSAPNVVALFPLPKSEDLT